MYANIWQTIVHFVSAWGPNNLIGVLVGSLLTLIGVFFRQIGNFLSRVFAWLWAIFSKRGKDYAFERAYLNWIINQHRYLGLLPARLVTSRWGEQRSVVNLEEVYVTLQISEQGGDQNELGIYSNISSSWRKRPWWHLMLRNGLLFTVLVLFAIIIPFLIGDVVSLSFRQSGTPIASIAVALISFLCLLLLLLLKRRLLREKETYQLGDLALAIDRHKQLVIRGDPGSGKTTLLRYLAITCARALRNNRKQGDTPDRVKKKLLWRTRPFPILVTLRLYHDVIHWSEKKRFIDTFFEEMPVELQKDCPEGFFERKLARGNCLILLDAFDELGSPEARAAMARRIGDFLNTHDHSRNRIVVTTRIVGYEGQLDRYDFQKRTVLPLKVGEVRALIKQRYRAVALSETAGWSSADAAPVLQDMLRRSERLIKKVESTPRLAQLATNPLLLSLIVLVHRVKLELPEERVLLYRDCVEILAEQWQRSKRADDVQPVSHEDLNLSQKLVLLQTIALHMQQQREEEDRQTLLPQAKAQEIVANKLPDILGSQLPTSEPERHEACCRRAEEWVKGIQVESGILVEQGLDEAGNPLVGFSHLTFQEYLAAMAINEDSAHQRLLASNLLEPVWREVVLLYVALTNDATWTIAQLLDAPAQPEGILLAGFCLAEKVKHVRNEVQQLALEKLKMGFEQADDSLVGTFGQALAGIGGNEVATFMRGQLAATMLAQQLAAIKALGRLRADYPQIKEVQEALVKLLETPNDVAIVVAVQETLAQIGDPRFAQKAPVVVPIPLQTVRLASSPKGWKELLASPEWTSSKKLRHRLSLIGRVCDYWLFAKCHPLRQRLPDKRVFAIGKYLVTNTEYARFVDSQRYHAPKHWIEGTFPSEKATHPVTGITAEDARAYCEWLSKETGEAYRLPTEWEWEWAATGAQGYKYSWGDQFDKTKCNTAETTRGETTPVGSYPLGASQYGITDMIGNVWEITSGYFSFFSLFSSLFSFFFSFSFLFSFLFSFFLFSFFFSLSFSFSFFFSFFFFLFFLFFLFLLFYFLFFLLFSSYSFSYWIFRGGAYNTYSDQTTCFFRKSYSKFPNDVGFRCAKNL